MLKVLRHLTFIVLALSVNSVFSQFTSSVGIDNAFINTKENYVYTLRTFNENETFSSYVVNSELRPSSQGIMFRSFGRQFQSEKKLAVGYSLEIGYNYFSSKSKLSFIGSSTSFRDSIVTDFDEWRFKTQYHVIKFEHFLDVHWNPTAKIKITNSLGVGLSAIVKSASPTIGFTGTIVNTNHPMLKFKYQPQITETYERCSITFFASIDLIAFELFKSINNFELEDNRIPISKIKFNAIGIRFIPNFRDDEVEVFDDFKGI